jgi:hypothetical protein
MGRGYPGLSMFSRYFVMLAAAITLLGTSLSSLAQASQTQDERERPAARLSAALGGPLEAGMSPATGPGNGILSDTVEPRVGRAEAYRREVARRARSRALLTSTR